MVGLPAALLRLASDDHLVRQLRGGSDGAFEVLFDRHHKAMLAFCRQMLGSIAEAEDVVQETFLAAYRGILRSSQPIAVRP
jgi:DNA-directed RNA polymerase specialized sigma24 family protein